MSTADPASQTPWITFAYQPTLSPVALSLGEAYSKCEHVGQSFVPPPLVKKLTAIYLARGALASTAIEGNTLTEEQAKQIVEGSAHISRSQRYQQQEILNVAEAITAIDESARTGHGFSPTPEWIQAQNRQVLKDLELEAHVAPGDYNTAQVVVGQVYRAADPREVPELVRRLCHWLEASWLAPSRDVALAPEVRFAYRFHAAALAHLYLAWIHPFGDGNGRTARLLECAILAHSDLVPWISSNLLSDHYNKTRTQYYARLAAASRVGDVDGFIAYSALGFADQLREQIDEIRKWIRFATWAHYVHEQLHEEPAGESKDRRRDLALALAGSGSSAWTKPELAQLTPQLAAAYARKSLKTVSRDLTRLTELQLVIEVQGRRSFRYRSMIDSLEAFRPFAEEHLDSEES